MKKEWGSWKVFMMGLGFLIIMLAPKTNQKYFTIIIGLALVIISFISIKKSPKEKGSK